jgi:hypothetical protein
MCIEFIMLASKIDICGYDIGAIIIADKLKTR